MSRNEILKLKYELRLANETTRMTIKQETPMKSKKSKVKQIVSKFNSKISQVIKRDRNVSNYTILLNQYSPESKPQPAEKTSTKPTPMPRKKFLKSAPSVPKPRQKTPTAPQSTPKFNACFAPEDIFAKLSVKEKARLYSQFVEEMKIKNPKFGSRKVVVEKQVSVKDLLQDFEFDSVFSKKTNSAAATVIQRMDSMKRACAARTKYLQETRASEEPEIKPASSSAAQNSSIELQSSFYNEFNQSNDSTFENSEIGHMFFSWLKEKTENDSGDIEAILNQSEKENPLVEKVLQQAVVKLDTVEDEQTAETAKAIPRKHIPDTSAPISSAKLSETEKSESGVSSVYNTASEESQQEGGMIKLEKDFEFAIPLKPVRKKKMHENTKGAEAKEKEPQQVTATETETDGCYVEAKLNKNQKLSLQEDGTDQSESRFSLEWDHTILKLMNSPRKIKSAYTLTVNDSETPIATPRSSSYSGKQDAREYVISSLMASKRKLPLTDAGSPLKKTALPESSPPIIYSPIMSATSNASKGNFTYSTPVRAQEMAANTSGKAKTNSTSASPISNSKTVIYGDSTPAKNDQEYSFATASASNSAKRLFSPIAKPMKNRRKSIYDLESARNSLVRQVIKEGHPFEPPQTPIKNSSIDTEQHFAAKTAPSVGKSPQQQRKKDVGEKKNSHFWIKCGDFSLTLAVDYVNSKRLGLLYDAFSQSTCNIKHIDFGIDNNKFSIHDLLDTSSNSTRIQASKESSHYWFSNGDLTIPFSGKILNTQKIERLFRLIKETVEETGVLRFGVDDFEFSTVPEFWYEQPKFSVDSQYNMLVGLQSGDSDGLEGRSKYAWPNSKPVIVTDLDQSDNGSYIDDDMECTRLSFAPFDNNRYDLVALNEEQLSLRRNSTAMKNIESYCDEYDNAPLDELFNKSCNQQEQQQAHEQATTSSATEMVNTSTNDNDEQVSNCAKPSTTISKGCLNHYKDTPEYLETLMAIVSDINKKSSGKNLQSCTAEQLESYIYFLNCYAEVCLKLCCKHSDTLLNVLVDK